MPDNLAGLVIKKSHRVIETINSSTVVVNAGKMHDIEMGKKCSIFAPERSIVDPRTQEDLGRLRLYKGEGVVTQTYEKFCVVRSVKRPSLFAFASAISMGEVQYMPFSEHVEVDDVVQFE